MGKLPNNWPSMQEYIVFSLFLVGTICTAILVQAAVVGIVLAPSFILVIGVINTVVPIAINRLQALGRGDTPQVVLNIPDKVQSPELDLT